MLTWACDCTANGLRRAVDQIEVEAALAERDAEIAKLRAQASAGDAFYRLTVAQRDAAWSEVKKLRAQIEALRKSREAWMEAYKNPHWSAYLAQTEAADAKARACGAI